MDKRISDFNEYIEQISGIPDYLAFVFLFPMIINGIMLPIFVLSLLVVPGFMVTNFITSLIGFF